MKKTLLKTTCFICILLGLIAGCCHVLKFHDSDGIFSMENFYKQEKDTVDVLFLGSSRVFENIDTGVLWDEEGIASYILAGSVQPMWNTYYYLKEAYKTQSPKLVVIDAYYATLWRDYHDSIRIIKNTFGLKWGPDRIRATMVSAPTAEWPRYFLPFIQYHYRYSMPSEFANKAIRKDPYYRDWKGYLCNSAVNETPYFKQQDTTTTDELWPKSEEYFRKTIELAQQHGSHVLVILNPYCDSTEWEQTAYNRCGQIAAEMGADFLNFNACPEVLGLDYAADFADNAHFNFRGAAKYAAFLGRYIREHFGVPDRRGEEGYGSWERNAAFLREYRVGLEAAAQ